VTPLYLRFFEDFFEILGVTFDMPVFTIDNLDFSELNVGIFDGLVTQRATMHELFHLLSEKNLNRTKA